MDVSVWSAANLTLATLRECNIKNVCFIGSLAAKLYGNNREPNDVDVLVLGSQYDPEAIKRMMAKWAPRFFYLEDPPPGVEWRKLYYHPDIGSARIKIDILIPGRAKLPSFHPRYINRQNERKLPAAPLMLVLLHKVLGWRKHSESREYYQYTRHLQDASDVINLLSIAQRRRETIDPGLNKFFDCARTWVREFMAAYPNDEIRKQWRSIGFEHELDFNVGLITIVEPQSNETGTWW